MSVMLINVTITRQVLSGAFPQRSKERGDAPRVIVLCCWRGKTRAPDLFCRRSLFHSSEEICAHYSSADVDPVVTCQHFFAEASSARSELFNANGRFLFPLCSTCHPMCHFDWQRNGGPICKCWLLEHPVWKDIHQTLRALFFFCLLVILSVRCCQGRRGVDHTLFL